MNTVWIVDDHEPFRRTLGKVLNRTKDLCCPCELASSEAMLQKLSAGSATAPDAILLDVGLPGMSGLDAIRPIRERAPQVNVIILTVFEDDDKIFRCIQEGACGYLIKTASVQEIVRSVREAIAGGSPMNPRIARRVLEMFSKLAPKPQEAGLSEREKEILQLMVNGMIKKEIAAALDLSVHTVDTYLRRIYEKLEVNTRTGAVARAIKDRLV